MKEKCIYCDEPKGVRSRHTCGKKACQERLKTDRDKRWREENYVPKPRTYTPAPTSQTATLDRIGTFRLSREDEEYLRTAIVVPLPSMPSKDVG